LLHDLASAVSRNGFDILNAIVSTRGGVVTDTFYVVLPEGTRPREEELGPLLAELDAIAGEPEGAGREW
jgi:UTP:GlnB (protein PII) uridylyltransferase